MTSMATAGGVERIAVWRGWCAITTGRIIVWQSQGGDRSRVFGLGQDFKRTTTCKWEIDIHRARNRRENYSSIVVIV